MIKLEDIRKPVRLEMKEFDKQFKETISSNVPLLNLVTGYVLRRKGKQMRPLFVFLTSKMTGGITESTYTAASLIELMHTATLVHDDVVDESNERRGVFSINAIWRSKVAVLLGDYLLAKGLLLAVEKKDYDLLEIVSNASKEMSEGELLQIQKSRSLNIDIDTYYDVIRKKTATLIASCTACGAKAAGAEQKVVDQIYDLGINIGMAFQIKDDLFDYQSHGIIGKPTGNDIKEKKFTLPLIYSLNQAESGRRKLMIRKIRNGNRSHKVVTEVVQFVKEMGGIEFAREKMQEFKTSAIDALQTFPDSPARESLTNLVEFTVSRNK
ncbi:MAG: polyprenyl synthetase family protein [Bacteroidales bacterium]|nr:polyprenyl synthetase family protein [Bacteroidales bacterium]